MKCKKLQITWLFMVVVAAYSIYPDGEGIPIMVDAANIREEPEMDAKIKFRLPYGTLIFGDFVDSLWFRIRGIKHNEQDYQIVTGYVHKTTLSAKFSLDSYSKSSIEEYSRKNGITGKDYLKIYEQAHAINPTDTVISRKLYLLYTEKNEHAKAASMDSVCKGLNPVLIAVPLLDGSIAVLGKLFPNGDFEQLTSECVEGECSNGKWQETLRIQLSSIQWFPVGECISDHNSYIYPALSIGTFGENEMGSKTEWIQLAPPSQRIHGIYKVRLNPEFVFASQRCLTLKTASLLNSIDIVNDRTRLDSLYTWMFPHQCENLIPEKKNLRTLTALSIPGSPYIDIGFYFHEGVGQCQRMARAIVDTAFNKRYVGSGNAGLWFRPVNWKNDIRISLAPHSNSLMDCESKGISLWIDLIVILNSNTVKTHEISLGGWG